MSNTSAFEFGDTHDHPGSAMTFDGATGYIEAADADAVLEVSNYTIEAWVKVQSQPVLGDYTILSKGTPDNGWDRSGFLLSYRDSGGAKTLEALHVDAGNTFQQLSVPYTLATNEWYHVASTYDGLGIRIYVNGVQVGFFATTTDPDYIGDGQSLKIGVQENASPTFVNHLHGSIDEVRIWNYAKNDFSDRFQSLQGNELGLVTYYPFEENRSGATVIDRTRNTLDGTINGLPAYSGSGAISPSGFVTVDVSTTQIDLIWTDEIDGETDYLVQRASDPAFTISVENYSAGVDATSFSLTALSSPQASYYRVAGILNNNDTSGFTPVKLGSIREAPGNALSFNGTSDFVTTPDPRIYFGTSLTLEAWVRIASAEDQGAIISHFNQNPQYDGFSLEIGANGSNGLLSFFANDGGSVVFVDDPGSTNITDDTWHHVAVTFDGAGADFYIDGAFTGNAPLSRTIALAGNDIFIGVDANLGGTRYLNGAIDEVRIWNTVRSPQQIADNRYKELTGLESGLVAYYQMDQETGSTVYDRSVNINNGTINGATIIQPVPNAFAGAPTPLTPTNFYITKLNDTQIQLNWTDNATNESGYKIEIADDYVFSSNLSVLTNTLADDSSFVHDVSPGDQYFYRLQAFTGTMESAGVIDFGSTEDFPGTALEFNGSHVVSTESEGVLSNFAIEAWVYPTDLSQDRWIYWRGNTTVNTGAEFYINTSGNVIYGENDGTYEAATSAGTLPLNKWSHVAANKSGTTVQIYINGILDGSNGSVSSSSDTGEITIGARNRLAGVDGFFAGRIDEVKIWSLSKVDFSDRYVPEDGNQPGLIAYYSFDENGGAYIVDRSVNEKDGFIVSSASFVNSDFTSPSEVLVDAVSSNTLSISWADNSDEDGFRILTSSSFDGPFSLLDSVSQDITNYNHVIGEDMGLYYVVESVKGDDASQSHPEFGTTTLFPGYALQFDNLDDFVSTTDNIDLSGDFTVEFWANRATSTELDVVFGQGDAGTDNSLHIGFKTGSFATFAFQGNDLDLNITEAGTLGDWNHWAFTYDRVANERRIYLNGAPVGLRSTGNLYGGSGQVFIGRAGFDGGHFSGAIDELRVWIDSVKTDFSDRNIRLQGSEPKLAAYYAFDENAGIRLTDRSVNTVDGVFSDTPQWIFSAAALPDTPQNLAAVVNGSGQPQLDWDDVPTAVSYVVERSQGDNTNFTQVATPTSSDFSDATIPDDGDLYYYRVSTFDGTNTSLASNEAIADIKGPGNALTFNGTDEFVTLTTTALAGGLTYSAWINTFSTDDFDPYAGNPAITIIGDFANSVYVTFGITDGHVDYHYNTNPNWERIVGNIDINDGEWHHVAVSHNASTGEVSLYVDGKLDAAGLIPYTAVTPGFNRIGGSYVDGTNTGALFDGSLDDIKIFNTHLTQQEIRDEIYNNDFANPALLAYYDFDIAEGAALPDLKSGINGTLSGGFVGDNTDWIFSQAYRPFIYQMSEVTSNDFKANWLQVSDATGYQIDYGTDQSFATFNTATIGHNDSLTTIAASLTPGTRYYARIAYENGGYTSRESAFVDFYVTPGFALDFDGTDDVVEIPASTDFDLGNNLTFEAWVNTTDGLGEIINNFEETGSPNEGFTFVIGNIAGDIADGIPRLYVSDSISLETISSDLGTINDGNWHHVAVAYDGATVTFYMDGVAGAAQAASGLSVGTSSNVIRIGRDNNNPSTRFFTGQLDEIRVWDYARTAEQIDDHRFNTLFGGENGLVAYYRFDQDNGSTLVDRSINNNDGTWDGTGGANFSPNWVASTAFSTENFVVTNTGNTGPGSLHQAILDANAALPGEILISFNLPNANDTIYLSSLLPAITQQGVMVDARTQPGWDITTDNLPTIDLSGVTNGDGLLIQAAAVEVYGLKINAARRGIDLNGEAYDNVIIANNVFNNSTSRDLIVSNADNLTLQGNRFGVSGDGFTAHPGASRVVEISGSDMLLVGGDSTLQEGNRFAGGDTGDYLLLLSNCSNANIYGNVFGIAADGFSDITNSRGLQVNGTNITVGGTGQGQPNYFGGINSTAAVLVSTGDNINVINNFVGLGGSGDAASPNATQGIRVLNTFTGTVNIDQNVIANNTTGIAFSTFSGTANVTNNIVGMNVYGIAASANTVYGVDMTNSSGITLEDNVISGNNNEGIRISQGGSHIIRRNLIGTDITGQFAIPNGQSGITIRASSVNNTIGGTNPGDGNLISGNVGYAINIENVGTTGNDIFNNAIGVSVDSSFFIANGAGGISVNAASDNNIGGSLTNEGNLIAGNAGEAVRINNTALNVRVIGNSMYGNVEGITLVTNGNNNQIPPVIQDLKSDTIRGVAKGATDGDLIHIYYSDTLTADQGRFYLGEASVASETWSLGGSFDLTKIHQATLTTADGTSPITMHYVINTNAPSGDNSFSLALDTLVGYSSYSGSISFDLPNDGSQDTISVSIDPADISSDLIIDGSTTPGWDRSANRMPHIKNNGCGCTLFQTNGGGLEVYGLKISGFTHGIWTLTGPGAIVGEPGKGNIFVEHSSAAIILNSGFGANIVQDNYIGVDWDMTPRANLSGLSLGTGSGAAIVGGTGPDEANVISGNTNDGIGTNASGGHFITGNRIGTDHTGQNAIPNGGNGIFIATTSSTNTIDDNIISSNGGNGIFFQGSDNNT
ncbi:MAG: hypothetical protein KI790_12385, partial [Cyclobacteriaceae bacterium]|nr:hypothetical protein [Cyclobacteriaceae bacterium HetDA_MAG_MS6]